MNPVFSEFEQAVLDLMCLGKDDSVIAQVLDRGIDSVRVAVRRIRQKLEAENRTHAVAKHLRPDLFNKEKP